MKAERYEILPGVMLSYVNTGKFKSSVLNITLLTQLNRETAALNALIPSVLLRGSVSYPDMEKITAASEELYGAGVYPHVRRFGEIQCIGLGATFPEEAYLPEGSDEFRLTAEFLAELLLNPVTEKKQFKEEYVESEKQKLYQLLESIKNDKRSYSLMRCIQEMCCYEDYSAGTRGRSEDIGLVSTAELTAQYRRIIAEAPVEIFYCGSEAPDRVCGVLSAALASMPRGDIDYDIGTDIRLNSLEEKARFCEERTRLNQSRLVIGFRLGDSMDEEDTAPMSVFDTVFGGGCTSKLFLNVRERLGLCYEVGSRLDNKKGVLFVLAGIDGTAFEAARDEIFAQLDAIRRGDVSAEELEAAKVYLAADMHSIEDGPGALENFWLSRALTGTDYTPAERAESILAVTLEDVKRVAENVECDMVYFLTGDEGTGAEDDNGYEA